MNKLKLTDRELYFLYKLTGYCAQPEAYSTGEKLEQLMKERCDGDVETSELYKGDQFTFTEIPVINSTMEVSINMEHAKFLEEE